MLALYLAVIGYRLLVIGNGLRVSEVNDVIDRKSGSVQDFNNCNTGRD